MRPVPEKHQLICATCGKILDMRNLGQIFSHDIGNGNGTYYCLPDEDELDIDYDGCSRVDEPEIYYPKTNINNPIILN